ncbi:hypothetical protein JXO52_12545 [bacterium]|nr:hypothetical protein [bacterium]
MRRQLGNVVVSAVLSVAAYQTIQAQEEQIPLLVFVEAQARLSVDYRSEGRLARNVIFLNSILGAAIDVSTSSQNSKKLQALGGDLDRTVIIEKGLAGGFSIQPYFRITTVHASDVYGTLENPRFEEIQKAGFSHVLIVKETRAGLITAWELSTLSAVTTMEYTLIEVRSGKPLFKDRFNSFALKRHTFDDAMTNPAVFRNDYPAAVGAAAGRIVGDLRKKGFLTLIAREYGLEDKVPDTGLILKQYERRFSYKFTAPPEWKSFAMDTKYTTVLAPKADKAVFGLNITFDLLLDILGQDVDTAEEYALLFLTRAHANGFELVPDHFDDLKTDDVFLTYTVEQKSTNITNIVLFKKLDEHFIVMYSVVMIGNYDELYKRYKSDIEMIINTGKIQTK